MKFPFATRVFAALVVLCSLQMPSLAQDAHAAATAFIGPDTIADLFDKVSPAVVNIVCTGSATRVQITRVQSGSDDANHKLKHHLGLERQPEEIGSQRVKTSGAGIIVRSDGYVLTCLHVVQNAEDVKVILSDGRHFEGKIVGRDGFIDLAMIKIESNGLPVVKFGDANKLRVGQWVFAIGNPYAYENSVSAGLISGLHREATSYSQAFGARSGAVTFIQTDVPLNVGSSGGPLLNLQGEVVGINSFIHREAQNIGFATPANLAKKVSEDLILKGSAPHPYLGIEMREQGELVQGPGLLSGVEVTKVKVPSPANTAGVQVGDMILEIDSTQVHVPGDVSRVMSEHNIGEHLNLKVKRGTADKTLSVKVESLPSEFD